MKNEKMIWLQNINKQNYFIYRNLAALHLFKRSIYGKKLFVPIYILIVCNINKVNHKFFCQLIFYLFFTYFQSNLYLSLIQFDTITKQLILFTTKRAKDQAMYSSRPFSQASSSRSSQKPSFQRKMKPRVSSGLHDHQNVFASQNLGGSAVFSQFNPSKSTNLIGKPQEQLNQVKFNQTASQISTFNFKNHCSDTCVCNECSCGRHLCKLDNVKPDLSKNTIYKKDYAKKTVIPNIVFHAKQYEKLKGPHLEINSTYLKSFAQTSPTKVEKPKPEDLLHSEGPSQKLTTYRSLFPGHKGQNQYVKPTDKHYRDKIPMRSKSTYAQSYVKKTPKKDDYKYIEDQLKTGMRWLGKTTYGSFFQNPNPQYHANKVKVVQKLESNPNFNHQYETVYKNDFIQKGVAICGAKIHLQTKLKGAFTGSKGNFAQNTDFKSMSPQFHAISTSKHSYV